IINAFFSNYGMAGVLVLISLYYSWATLQPQQPTGESAAKILAKQIAGLPGNVLIIAKNSDEDTEFVNSLNDLLTKAGHTFIGKVQGGPRDARIQLEKVSPDIIATTPECASWTVLEKYSDNVRYAASYRWPTFLKAGNLLNVANQI